MLIENKVKTIWNSIVQNRTVLFYVSTSFLKSIGEVFAIFQIATHVSVVDLGLWTVMLTFSSYANVLTGGIVNGVNRELPYFLSRNQINLTKSIISASQVFLTGCVIITLIIGISISVFYLYSGFFNKAYIFLSVTIITVTNFYTGFLQSTFRSNSDFDRLSFIQILYTVASLFSIILIYYFGFYGMISRIICIQLFLMFLLHNYRPFVEPLKWNYKIIFLLLKTGLPIFIMSYIHSVALISDRWIVKYYADDYSVGIYSFSLYAFSTFAILINAIGSFLYPKFTFLLGSTNDSNQIMWAMFIKTTKFLLLIFVPMSIILFFLIPFIVKSYFSNYVAAIQSMQILMIAGALNGLSLGANILWSMKKWRYMASLQLSNALLLVLCPLILIRYLDVLQAVSLGICIAFIVHFILTIFLVRKATF
ncbi:hypothetical protein [Flavobacterium sp.]|uniref:hypothetical protein n=1 Tax=Flavobacterium sp. TaxID=239 RepID=UPI0037C0DE7E